jgi:hypothetical protein
MGSALPARSERTKVVTGLFTVLLIAGGVALILFATRQLREGLDRLVGARLGPFLQNASRTPVRAFLAGLGASSLRPAHRRCRPWPYRR